jgi:hypothetical protein
MLNCCKSILSLNIYMLKNYVLDLQSSLSLLSHFSTLTTFVLSSQRCDPTSIAQKKYLKEELNQNILHSYYSHYYHSKNAINSF